MAALVFKVFTLTIKTAAKPLAGRFQAWVLHHPTLRPAVVNLAQVSRVTGVIASSALLMQLPSTSMPGFCLQKMHKVEVGISRAAEGKVGKVFVGNMSDERALELASKVVSEGFVFGVSHVLDTWTDRVKTDMHWCSMLKQLACYYRLA